MTIDINELRLLVRDDNRAVFADEALEAAAAAAGDSLLRAAGIAFTSLAAEYAAIGRSIRTDDLAINTTSRGSDLLAVAKSFFAEAAVGDASAGDDVFKVVRRPVRGRVVRPEGTAWPYGSLL